MALDSYRIGEMLLSSGSINEKDLEEALQIQEDRNEPIGSILVSLGALTREELDTILADHFGVPFVDLDSFHIEPSLKDALPAEIATRHRVTPLFLSGDSLMIATPNPDDIVAIDEIKEATGFQIDLSYAFEEEVDLANRRLYGTGGTLATALATLVDDHRERSSQYSDNELIDGGPVGRIVDTMLQYATEKGCSDLHIEPMNKMLRWRIRVDGLLEEGPPIPTELHGAIVARIKVLADLDISETRQPQDGHFPFERKGAHLDIRVSIIPTVLGENAVLRVIELSKTSANLDSLGIVDQNKKRVDGMLSSPHGMVLVSGPTGSGKTTTLYSMLSTVESPIRHIITIEDPVERHLEWARQIEVNEKANLTFSDGLRAILRHDPDIIMVGEIRDTVSAEIAVQAALTGHLLLSSIHTNDAPSAVARLLDLGLDPFLLAASIRGVVAQRLIRKICAKCRAPYTLNEGARLFGMEEDQVLYRATGCNYCGGKGYDGRLGIFEVMTVEGPIAEAITSGASTETLRRLARDGGMSTLREEGLRLVAEGFTTLEEVVRMTA